MDFKLVGESFIGIPISPLIVPEMMTCPSGMALFISFLKGYIHCSFYRYLDNNCFGCYCQLTDQIITYRTNVLQMFQCIFVGMAVPEIMTSPIWTALSFLKGLMRFIFLHVPG